MNINKSEQQIVPELVDRIDKIRVENNYSMYELACRADTSPNTIKNLYKKKANPNIRTICNICEALEIPVWILFYQTDSGLPITKATSLLLNNYEKLSEKGKNLLLELSENMK